MPDHSLIFFIIPITWILEGNPFKVHLAKRDILILFAQALCGMFFLFRIFLLEGLKYTTAMEGGMITSTAPAMLAILSVVFFLKEGLSTPVILGILLCVFFGIVLINIGDLLASQNPIELSGNVIGNSLILMAVIGESFFSILRKKSCLLRADPSLVLHTSLAFQRLCSCHLVLLS